MPDEQMGTVDKQGKTQLSIVVAEDKPPQPEATGEYCTRKGCFAPEDMAIINAAKASKESSNQSDPPTSASHDAVNPRPQKRKSTLELAKRGSTLYMSEFASPITKLMQKDAVSVRNAVGAADVVVYSLDGCSFCQTAATLLDSKKIEFTTHYPKGSEVSDLKTTLGVPLIAFPAIFIRGRYIGSFDRLEDANNTGLLEELLAMPMDPLGKLPDPMKLSVAARGGSILTFQRYLYGNWARVWHAVQAFSFIAIMALSRMEGTSLIITCWFYFLVFDWLVFIILGPVPAPLGTLCLAVVWKFRGPAVPAVPYKIRQFFYVNLVNGMILDGRLNDAERAVLFAHIINSSLIAFFRF
jgi:glutaredoxin